MTQCAWQNWIFVLMFKNQKSKGLNLSLDSNLPDCCKISFVLPTYMQILIVRSLKILKSATIPSWCLLWWCFRIAWSLLMWFWMRPTLGYKPVFIILTFIRPDCYLSIHSKTQIIMIRWFHFFPPSTDSQRVILSRLPTYKTSIFGKNIKLRFILRYCTTLFSYFVFF
jgi:hypothetical protein